MSYLELGGSFEFDGYFVVITTGLRGDALWTWVEFERDVEYGERSVHIPVYRHRVPGTYSTKLASVEAGAEYAYRTLADETVAVH